MAGLKLTLRPPGLGSYRDVGDRAGQIYSSFGSLSWHLVLEAFLGIPQALLGASCFEPQRGSWALTSRANFLEGLSPTLGGGHPLRTSSHILSFQLGLLVGRPSAGFGQI